VRVSFLQHICGMTLCLASASAFADVHTLADSFVADVNVRHHLIPGIKLNAKNLSPANPAQPVNKLSNPGDSALPSQQLNQQIAVPPPPDSKRTAGAMGFSPAVSSKLAPSVAWQPYCSAPVRVSLFGDFWVAPHSPAADLKNHLFDNLKPLLNWADFNVANFEGNLTSASQRAFPSFPFALKQAPDSLQWLASAGVKYFTRANNHAMDFGWVGAQETSAAIKKAGMYFAGIGENLQAALRPMWLEKNGLRIAVFSVTTTYPAEAWAGQSRPGVAFPSPQRLKLAIEKTRADADFIVVAFHWGEELKPTLRGHQEQYAKAVMAAGADVVVGHHAHVAQSVDVSADDGIVVYGLGNFVFASLSRDAKFALGSHFEFCRTDTADRKSSAHSFRMVLSPLLTFNRITGYKSRMMTLNEFLPFAREYVKKGYFSPELEFFIPGEDRVQTLAEWLQPRSQASNDGHTAR